MSGRNAPDRARLPRVVTQVIADADYPCRHDLGVYAEIHTSPLRERLEPAAGWPLAVLRDVDHPASLRQRGKSQPRCAYTDAVATPGLFDKRLVRLNDEVHPQSARVGIDGKFLHAPPQRCCADEGHGTSVLVGNTILRRDRHSTTHGRAQLRVQERIADPPSTLPTPNLYAFGGGGSVKPEHLIVAAEPAGSLAGGKVTLIVLHGEPSIPHQAAPIDRSLVERFTPHGLHRVPADGDKAAQHGSRLASECRARAKEWMPSARPPQPAHAA